MKFKWRFVSGAALIFMVLIFLIVRAGDRSAADSEQVSSDPAQNIRTERADASVQPEETASPAVTVQKASAKKKTENITVTLSDTAKKEEENKARKVTDEMDDEEREQMLNQQFEAEAIESFPLYTIETHDPLYPQKVGPSRGEVWVRIKPGAAPEVKDIMAQLADLYKSSTYYDAPVTVMNWVGGRPHMRFRYPPEEERQGETAVN